MLAVVTFDGTPTSLLRQTSTNVLTFNREIRELADAMIETMFSASGVGLAAPQVGILSNLFVMRTADGLANNTRECRVVFNPVTLAETGVPTNGVEGCLSIPRLVGDVLRYPNVEFSFVDGNGTLCTESLSGLAARIYQHEYDHLIGTLFMDRATRLFQPK